ncbi:porin [Duganella sp. BJB488]|uniref:porin n=1 Tax=unclassified Duganella TaxID=2636909 RepID=UPI000E3517F3|nr:MULTISPECIES: porin [unclassified Duganella]NVD70431.1 porin [Duganella sp. BJB1802]RFP24149.1 porin [Duganella sp. BJB489]RFP26510.1 porin [Duganella sp. BJB488]RFP34758.1 porin [Duganella sp. BJB480]
MKKSLVALALMGAFAGAYAQSSVTIYGTVDAGISKRTGTTTQVGKRDNNKLGFKGVEDLGSGLKAIFQLEIRYEPDTGAVENTTATTSRPLFQGQSRVGLQGDFGTVRLGRGLTAFQETSTAFEPWSGMPGVAGYQTDLQVAGYTSDPMSPVGNSNNRFSNAVFYNTPMIADMFQLNVTVAAKEANGNPAIVGKGTTLNPQFPANTAPLTTPYSLSATAANGPFAAYAAYEKNAIETKLWSIGASFKPINDLKLMGSYQKQDQSSSTLINPNTKAWLLGANYTVGAGMIRVGYGQKTPDNALNNPALAKTKQASIGYDYNLSARTYLYVDASNKKAATTLNFYSLGIHHNF